MLSEKGKLDESLIDNLWKDVLDEKPLLLELMKKFDLICECLPVDMENFPTLSINCLCGS
jgi:hypothetical protein